MPRRMDPRSTLLSVTCALALMAPALRAAGAGEVLGRSTYRDAPGEIDMQGAYRTFARLCFAGQMDEAERRGMEVLDQLGYRGTRYECWVHDKLADGYERVRNSSKAIEYWQKSMCASDSSKGSWTRARDKLRQYGGSIPSEALRPVQRAPQVHASAPRAPLTAPASAATRGAPTQARATGSRTALAAPITAKATAPGQSAPRLAPAASTPRVGTPAVTPTSTAPAGTWGGVPNGALATDAEYAQAIAELRNGGYQELRMALKRFEGLLLDRGYQGTAAESELQARIADAHIALAAHHYRWAEAAAGQRKEPSATDARQRAQPLSQVRADAR